MRSIQIKEKSVFQIRIGASRNSHYSRVLHFNSHDNSEDLITL